MFGRRALGQTIANRHVQKRGTGVGHWTIRDRCQWGRLLTEAPVQLQSMLTALVLIGFILFVFSQPYKGRFRHSIFIVQYSFGAQGGAGQPPVVLLLRRQFHTDSHSRSDSECRIRHFT